MDILFLALLGLIVGSFLNVYICRMHTGKSLGGRSHCLSCGITLVWYELIPALSYLLLGGRCRHCTSRIGVRYLLVEMTTAGLLVLSFLVSTGIVETLILFVLSIGLMITVVYDLMHTIIPDEMVALLLGSAIALGVVGDISWGAHVLAACGAAAFFAFFWFVSKGKWMGLGDAKLAFPLGMIIGPLGSVSMIMLAFWVGAAVSLVLIGLQKGKTHMSFLPSHLTMKSEIPFAPFLILGFVCVYFFHVDIFTITDVVTAAILGY